ncbi:MAG TPA: O-antigen ligase family protein [Blastocatellia bacterium]|nr:O-antigen ligase family protein [Blastocatellia bacterium]
MTEDHASGLTTNSRQRIHLITERAILCSLTLYALFAPHSIALTQGAYLLGMAAWCVQIIAARRYKHPRTPVDVALLGFFACCVISSFLSYYPLISIKGLRSPAFFLAFYFVAYKVKNLKFAYTLALVLVGSCLVNVAYSAGQLAIGRGLQIDSIKPESQFAKQGLQVGDVILEADGKKLKTIEDLSNAINAQRGRVKITFQRSEMLSYAILSRRKLINSAGFGGELFGITTSPGRSFRVSGFYSHYETYAEVLQLIGSLAIGLLIALPNKRSGTAIFLGVSILLIAAALIMTSTRAAMAGLATAAAIMAIISFRRRVVVFAMLAILLLSPVALYVLQKSRGISMIDLKEGSTAYRLEVWKEAFGLIVTHPLTGIGKGSEGMLKEELGLFGNGRLPQSHFHSTPIQIAVWWGLPALAFYFALMTILARESWKLSRFLRAEGQEKLWGLALGGIGVIVSFNVSSIVHFNFGDGEVVMTLWLVTGLVFAVRRIALAPRDASRPENTPAPPAAEGSRKSLHPTPAAAAESNARAATARPDSQPR